MAGLSKEAIQGIIRRKVAEWLQSIDDAELRTYLGDKIMVTGGCIPSMMLGEKLNDFDIYLTDYQAALKVAKYYCQRFAGNPPRNLGGGVACRIYVKNWGEYQDQVHICVQSAGVAAAQETIEKYEYFETQPQQAAVNYVEQVTASIARDEQEQQLAMELAESDDQPGQGDADFEEVTQMAEKVAAVGMPPLQTGPGAKEKNRYRPLFLSGNAITLSDKVQICVRFFGAPDDIHANFDFVHCTNYWRSRIENGKLSGDLVLNLDAMESLSCKKLRYIGSKYPLCSLIRTRKFVARGWKAPASVFIKPMIQCTYLDWNKIETWRDQLTGVDTAYFAEIIEILKRDQASGKQIDAAYVIALIDKLV